MTTTGDITIDPLSAIPTAGSIIGDTAGNCNINHMNTSIGTTANTNIISDTADKITCNVSISIVGSSSNANITH